MDDTYMAPLELKFVEGGQPGEIEGYGAIFGNVDSHGDVILPGAFATVLNGHKAAGTMPTMYVEHGPALGGSTLPDGVWTHMEEDAQGLRVKGKISALDTDHGRRIRSLVQDGALKGLSIGFRLGAGNAIYGKKSDEPRRRIKSFDKLVEVSLVTTPSNALAKVASIKAAGGNTATAIASTQAALKLLLADIAEDASDPADATGEPDDDAANDAQMLAHLQDIHEALTGQRMPAGMKSTPKTVPELKAAFLTMGFSPSRATELATRALKRAEPREVEVKQAVLPAGAAADLRSLLGFTLPSFRT